MAFSLPQFHRQYYAEIVERCEGLINAAIWSGIHITRFRQWLRNFDSDEEQYFAACVLDSLVYRSDLQTLALMDQLFDRVLPDLVRLHPPPCVAPDDWRHALSKRIGATDPGVRLVPVINDNDPPTKSGFLLARALKRHMQFDERWIAWPRDIHQLASSGVKIFIFVDDFLGTGDQFTAFATSTKISTLPLDAYLVYAPLAAHISGVDALNKAVPNLLVAATETLTESAGIFHQSSQTFSDGLNTIKDAMDFYFDLLTRKGIILGGSTRRGYGGMELAYSFEHSIPDNCLPILWWNRVSTWQCLFDR